VELGLQAPAQPEYAMSLLVFEMRETCGELTLGYLQFARPSQWKAST